MDFDDFLGSFFDVFFNFSRNIAKVKIIVFPKGKQGFSRFRPLKINQKSTLGRPRVDILSSWGRFLRGRKIIDFLIARGSAKNRENWPKGPPRGAKGTSTRSRRECKGSATGVQRGDALAEVPQGGFARGTVK